jgi:hypothetical protein
MPFDETARRKSTTSQEEIDKRFDAISVFYCSECASKNKLPISSRVITLSERRKCDICGEEKTMYGSVMKDSQLLNHVQFTQE